MRPEYCFRTVNGVSTGVAVAASSLLNNRTIGSALVIFQPDTVTPGTQRNMFGKSTGGNNNVMLNNAGGFSYQYSGGSGGQVALNCAAPASAFPFVSNMPCIFAATWSFGVEVTIYGGMVGGVLLREASSYTIRNTGVMGTTPHDDSATPLYLCGASGGGNVLTGYFWSIQWWDRVLPLPVLQQYAREYNPAGTLGSWRLGANGLGVVVDDSGHGLHAPVTAGVNLSSDLPLVHRRGRKPTPWMDDVRRGATTTLNRVQATAKVTADNTPTIAITLSTLPTIGNGLVIPITAWGGTGFPSSGCVDNRGNIYGLAHTATFNSIRVAFYYCPKVTASSAPFTITITPSSNCYMTANAIEVSGVGSVGLAVDQVSSGSLGSSTTPSSGSTPALTTSEALLVAALGCNTSKGSITAQVVSPVWTQEIEELSNAHAVGETDSRIVSSAAGTTPVAQWTLNTADSWVAAIVAFKVGVAAPIGITLISDRQYTAPAAADSISITPSGVAWTNSAYVTVLDPTPAACVLTGITTYTGDGASNSINYDAEIDIATGAAGVEVVIATVRVANNLIFQSGVTGPTHWSGMPIPIDAIGSGVRVSARLRKNNTNLTPWTVAITYLQKPLTSLIQTTIAAPKTLPPAAAGVAVTASSTLWANGSWAQLRAASGASLVITGVALRMGSGGTFELDLGIGGAGAETVITTLRLETANQGQPGTLLLPTPLNAVPSSARLSARLRGSVASGSLTLSLMVLENPL